MKLLLERRAETGLIASSEPGPGVRGVRFSAQTLRSLSAGSRTETRGGFEVFSLNEAAPLGRDSLALTR